MKSSDILIYVLLISIGILVGWLLRGATSPIPSIEQAEYPTHKTIPSTSTHDQDLQVDFDHQNYFTVDEQKPLSSNVPEAPLHTPTKVDTKTKEPLNVSMDSSEVKNKLLQSNFYEALLLLAKYKNTAGLEALTSETLERLIAYVKSKVANNEGQNLLMDIERALAEEPGCFPIILLKGRVYLEMGEFEQGATNLRKEFFYMKDDKEYKELQKIIRFLRAKYIESLKEKKLIQRLTEYYEELIVEDSAYAPYYFELAALYIQKDDLENALVLLRLIVFDQTYGKDAEALISKILAAQEVRAVKRKYTQLDAPVYEIPLNRLGDHYTVTVLLNGSVSVNLLVDTGANMSIISENIAKKLGYQIEALKDVRWFKTAGGMIRQPVGVLNQLKLSNIQVEKMQVAISKEMGDNFDGLLGMDFLGQFNFEFNQDHNTLVLKVK